jgi:hypothetical protein
VQPGTSVKHLSGERGTAAVREGIAPGNQIVPLVKRLAGGRNLIFSLEQTPESRNQFPSGGGFGHKAVGPR